MTVKKRHFKIIGEYTLVFSSIFYNVNQDTHFMNIREITYEGPLK